MMHTMHDTYNTLRVRCMIDTMHDAFGALEERLHQIQKKRPSIEDLKTGQCPTLGNSLQIN